MEGSCASNASLPSPHWRNCSVREQALYCGVSAAFSECRAFLNQTGLYQCICNAPDGIPNPRTLAAFGTAQCLLRDSVYDSCTSAESFRCGSLYTAGCLARYGFQPLDRTLTFEGSIRRDPLNANRFIHNSTVPSDPTRPVRKVECFCTSTHSSFDIHIRSDFAPNKYAGPSLFPPASFPNASDPASTRRTLAALNCGTAPILPTFPVDISCSSDFLQRQLRYGRCPVSYRTGNIISETTVVQAATYTYTPPPPPLTKTQIDCLNGVKFFLSASICDYELKNLPKPAPNETRGNETIAINFLTNFATLGGDSSAFVQSLMAVYQRTGSAYAPQQLLDRSLQCSADPFAWNRPSDYPPAMTPAFYSSSAVNLSLNTTYNPTPCNGIGYCVIDEARLANVSSVELQNFVSQFESVAPQIALLAVFGGYRFTGLGEPCDGLLCKYDFARPGAPNQCTYCGGSRYQFFYGPRCDLFDCPANLEIGVRGYGSNLQVYPPYYRALCSGIAASFNCPFDPNTGTACHFTKRITWIPPAFTGRGPLLCGNGYFDFTIGDCVCDPGYSQLNTGPNPSPLCVIWNCPDDCINGYCDSANRICVCNTGFTGPTCNSTLESLCSSTCDRRGYCSPFTGQCVCDSGSFWNYTGPSCQTLVITSNETCQNGGVWTEGADPHSAPYCRCTGLWTGRLCQVNACPLSVVDGRRCGNGQCIHPGSLSSLETSLLLRPTCSCPATTTEGYRGSGCEYTLTHQSLCFKSNLVNPICNSADDRCRFSYLFTNSSLPLIKNGSCVCPEPFITPHCEYTRCDNITFGK